MYSFSPSAASTTIEANCSSLFFSLSSFLCSSRVFLEIGRGGPYELSARRQQYNARRFHPPTGKTSVTRRTKTLIVLTSHAGSLSLSLSARRFHSTEIQHNEKYLPTRFPKPPKSGFILTVPQISFLVNSFSSMCLHQNFLFITHLRYLPRTS